MASTGQGKVVVVVPEERESQKTGRAANQLAYFVAKYS